jgi:hypothetical protein
MHPKKPFNIKHSWTQSWPNYKSYKENKDWTDHIHDKAFIRMLNDMTTDLVMHQQDLQELQVELSKNKLAQDMLSNIGIKC